MIYCNQVTVQNRPNHLLMRDARTDLRYEQTPSAQPIFIGLRIVSVKALNRYNIIIKERPVRNVNRTGFLVIDQIKGKCP